MRGDENRSNNIGSRRCSMSWNGSAWLFDMPSSDNPLQEGPAPQRYGPLRTSESVSSTDGSHLSGGRTSEEGVGCSWSTIGDGGLETPEISDSTKFRGR